MTQYRQLAVELQAAETKFRDLDASGDLNLCARPLSFPHAQNHATPPYTPPSTLVHGAVATARDTECRHCDGHG